MLIGGTAGTFWFGGYRINTTPSYPLGLWQIEPLKRQVRTGDRIFICLPEGDAATLALKRRYLPRGLCPSGSGPLIKMVVAAAGQVIEVNEQVVVDGTPLTSSHVHDADGEGRSLPIYAGGVVGKGHVFLHSDFEGSYDSRYFGPVPTSGALGLAREVFTYAP